MFDVLIRGGQVVCDGSVLPVDVGIDNGRIAALLSGGASAEARRVIDAAGKTVIPGVIDAHHHFSTPTEPMADTFATSTRAAAHGGVTTVIPFIQGDPDEPVKSFLQRFRREGEARSMVDFAMHCRLATADMKRVAQVPDAIAFGVTSIKVFLDYRKAGIMWDSYHLLALAEAVAREGALLMCHCEDGELIDRLEDEMIAARRYGPDTLLESRPNALEASSIARVAMIAKMAGCRVHVVHLSSKEGLAEIMRARQNGVRMDTETCPQYLLLDDADTRRLDRRSKIGPPLRQKADQEAMWFGLQTGAIEIVASDHAAFRGAEKDCPGSGYEAVPFGMPSVETMLPLLYSEGVLKGRLSIARMADALSTSVAKIYGLYPRKGAIQVGSDADLVLLDPNVEWTLRAAEMHSESDYTAYEGWKLQGRPVLSMLRGEVLMEDGQLRRQAVHAEYLPRQVG